MNLRPPIVCLLIAISAPQFGFAFCLVPQPRLVCAEYYDSDLIVEATLIKADDVTSKVDPEGVDARIYSMRVDQILRGHTKSTLNVFEGNDSGRASFDWVPGAKYLLFLKFNRQLKAWVLDGCGNSNPIGIATRAKADIQKIKAENHSGIISGKISHSSLSDPIADVRVEAFGNGRHYSAVSDKKGNFTMRVPVGNYSLRAISPTLHFAKADISYGDPANLNVQPGGCAQVQFAQTDEGP